MPIALGALALALYVVVEGLYVAALVTRKRLISRGATALLATAFVTHFTGLYLRAREIHSVPYRDVWGSMSLFALFLVVVVVVLDLRHPDQSLGPYLVPPVAAFALLALHQPGHATPAKPELSGPIFAFHVTANIFAYAAFAVSCVVSGLYLFQARQLKRRQLGSLVRSLPSLEYLDRANRTSLTVGVGSLVVGLSLGMVWAHKVWHEVSRWMVDPKILLALLTAGFYIALLVLESRGFRGRRTAMLSIAGFALVLLSYTAVNLAWTGVHSFR